MSVERIPQSELPKQEPWTFNVTVANGFFGENPRWDRHKRWNISYKPEKWYSWRQLQTDEELDKLGIDHISSRELLNPLSPEQGKKKIGVYEVVRGWKCQVPGKLNIKVRTNKGQLAGHDLWHSDQATADAPLHEAEAGYKNCSSARLPAETLQACDRIGVRLQRA